MYDQFQDDIPPPRSPLRKVLYAVIVLLIIAGLLGSSAVALWRLAGRSQDGQTAEATRSITTPPPAADDQESAQAAPAEDVQPPGRIAYVSPDGRMATISPDGSGQRFLSDNTTRFRFPAWSPQGRQLAAIGGGARGAGVYILADEAGGEPVERYFSRSQAPFYLYWSPDGRHITFLTNHTPSVLALHLVSADADSTDRLLATGIPFYWHWTAAGDQILIHTGFAGTDARLEFIDIAGSGAARQVARPGFFQAPGISASGRYLAYAEETVAGWSRLVVADTRSGAEQQERHAGLVAMGWSPTGDQLALISAAEEEQHFHGPLRLLDAESGELTLLSRERVLAFFWSPDGRHLATISGSERGSDISVRAPADYDEKRSRLARAGSRTAQGSQPFQLKLSVIEAATGQTRLLSIFEPTDNFLSQFLPFFDQYALSHRLWSPDSKALVIPVRRNGADRVVVVRVADGRQAEIAVGAMPFWSHQ